MSEFVIRKPKQNKVDFVEILNKLKELHPKNSINPNSILYQAAVNQYNDQAKGTLNRPPIPSWFCGSIDNDTGELLIINDQSLRQSAGVIETPIDGPIDVNVMDLGDYEQDRCLPVGTPGSVPYSTCSAAGDPDDPANDTEVSNKDWGSLGAEAYADAIEKFNKGADPTLTPEENLFRWYLQRDSSIVGNLMFGDFAGALLEALGIRSPIGELGRLLDKKGGSIGRTMNDHINDDYEDIEDFVNGDKPRTVSNFIDAISPDLGNVKDTIENVRDVLRNPFHF